MNQTTERAFLGPTELCGRWGLDKKTVLAAVKRGEIPATFLGRKILIPRAWVEGREAAAPADDPVEPDGPAA